VGAGGRLGVDDPQPAPLDDREGDAGEDEEGQPDTENTTSTSSTRRAGSPVTTLLPR
jgi:hypothetical protein